MKFNVLRRLLIPWVTLFLLIISAILFAGAEFQQLLTKNTSFMPSMIAAIALCIIDNFRTTSKAGIWISHSIPDFLRRQPLKVWFSHLLLILAIAGVFYGFGTLSFAPLYWNGFVVPIAITLCLVALAYVLIAPILNWCSKMAFTRFFAMVLTFPILLMFPVSGIYLGQFVLSAYLASRPQPLMLTQKQTTKLVPVSSKAESTKPLSVNSFEPRSEQAQKLKEFAQSPSECAEHSREIQAALVPSSSDDVLYWALKCVKHAKMKPVVGLSKLVDLFMKSKNPIVRANAIASMAFFPQDAVQSVAYLLFKRIHEQEAPEVIQAAASVLAKCGETEKRIALKKLQNLMNHPSLGQWAAESIIQINGDDSLVTEFVVNEIQTTGGSFAQALDMICLLSKPSLAQLKPHLGSILSAIKTGASNDPAVRALACFEAEGIELVQKEVLKPNTLKKEVAAKALSSLPIKNSNTALKTMVDCINDKDESVRKWCSQGLGHIGAAALPKIVDLLGSPSKEKFNAGQEALLSFKDVQARQELLKLREANSGWTASQKKLRVNKAIDSALVNLVE